MSDPEDDSPARRCLSCGLVFRTKYCSRCAFSFAEKAGLGAGEEFDWENWTPWSPPDRQFQHYLIEANDRGGALEVGRRGMGITYRAMDLILGIPVVLKFIHPRLFSGATSEERFVREASRAARLRHPNVAGVLHAGVEGLHRFYAMEFVSGWNLEHFVQREGPQDAVGILEIARQVAAALRATESLQLVHRDLKPSHLMIEKASNGALGIKLIDFGLLKSLSSPLDWLTEDGFCGTPCFASPEQLSENALDHRSDYYSLGASLYFAHTGRTLTAGTNAQAAAAHLYPPEGHLLLNAARLAPVHESLRPLLKGLLEPSRENRPANGEQLLRLIDESTTAALSRLA